MHPAISSFPNKEFYNGKIQDATTVKTRSHERSYLKGNMYGAYSFINVSYADEQFDHLHSRKNMIEVAVVCKIVDALFKEFSRGKQRMSIGVISPYNAQVHAIQDKLEKKYSGYVEGGFSVSIRSVDGFQGGEEDVIIISTVRCNINGRLGFLSNLQRTNVALTRARHCLWILGNEATLVKSDSIWKKLITDAKRRGCFYNAEDDNTLAEAVVSALIQLKQFHTLLLIFSLRFKHSKWRVCYSEEFWKSMAGVGRRESRKEVSDLIRKLCMGWRSRTVVEQKNKHVAGCLGLLQAYPVNAFLSLLWSVQVIKEDSHLIQVLKVWDVSPFLDVPKIAKRLKISFREYTLDNINRCKSLRFETRNCVVPMRWEVEQLRLIGCDKDLDETMKVLSKPFAALSLVDE